MIRIPRLKAGQRQISARAWDALCDYVEWFGRLKVSPPLSLVNAGGSPVLTVMVPQEAWLRIDSGTHPYGWTEMDPDSGGTWVESTTGRTGTTTADPAYETSGNDSVPTDGSAIVRAFRANTTGEWLFQYGGCPE